MICHCMERVDSCRVRTAFDATWLKGGVAASDPPTLSCSLCERLPLISTVKKKRSGWLVFGGKSKEEVEPPKEVVTDDLMMCLTCTLCFCADHVKSHYDSQEKSVNELYKLMRSHNVFFGVSSGTQTHRKPLSAGKMKTVLPEVYADDVDRVRENEILSMDRENFALRRGRDQPEEVYTLYCVCCSKSPVRIMTSNCSDNQMMYAHLRRLGATITRMLHFFHRGIRMECRGNEAPLSQTATCSSEITSKTRSCADLQVNRERMPDVDAHTSHSSSVGTSSALVRCARGDTQAMASAHIAGIENLHNTCYFNSVLQCVLKCRFFVHFLLSLGEAAQPGPLTACLSALIRHLRDETVADIQTRAVYPYVRAVLQRLSEIAPMFAEDEQQDSQELFLSMINGVGDELDKGKTEEQKKMGPRLPFEGVVRTEVRCAQCGSHFPREESFMAISVPIEDSIESGLRKLFGPTYLTKKDQYACEMCFNGLSKEEQERHNASVQAENQKKEKSKKKSTEEKKSLNCVYSDATVTTSINRLGGTLALHLLRFHYDGRSFHKVTRSVSFPTSLDLTPFVTKEVLKEYGRTHGLYALQTRFPHVRPSVILRSFESTGYNLLETERLLRQSMKAREEEMANIDERSDVEHALGSSNSSNDIGGDTGYSSTTPTFSATSKNNGVHLTREPLPSLKRELIGIVTHRGSLHGGHYIAYVRDMRNPNLWFRCDDEDVETVDKEYIFRCQSEVYMLFYE